MASPKSSTANGHTANGHASTTPPGGANPAGANPAGANTAPDGLTVAGHTLSGPIATGFGAPAPRITIGDIARLLNAELVGDAQTLITGVAGLDSAVPGSISFIENEDLLKTALRSSAAAIIAPHTEQMATKMRRVQRRGGKPALLIGNPRLAFAKVMEFMKPSVLPERGVHATAVIETDAYIGEGVTIREGCYVGHHAHIADGAVLYPHVYIGDGAQIGASTILYPSVVIAYQVQIGARVRIHSGSVIGGDGFGYVLDEHGKHYKMPQVGTVILEDDVEVGANVCIDRATMGATRVGSGTKIDNLVQIGHNCQIGRNCILCGQVGLSGSVVVEDGVMMAGQAGLADHVTIGKGAVLGAKAGIMADVKAGEFVLGSPAVTTRDFMRMQAAARKLPEALRSLKQLERQVRALQEQLHVLVPDEGGDEIEMGDGQA